MYSRYGLYFRFTALQTVCKYDQLNEGKKKVLSVLLIIIWKTNLEINWPGSKFQSLHLQRSSTDAWLLFFLFTMSHNVITQFITKKDQRQKTYCDYIPDACMKMIFGCSCQINTDPGCAGWLHTSHFTFKNVFADHSVYYILVGSFCFLHFVGIPVLSNSSFSLM